jgi:hypothetical protein
MNDETSHQGSCFCGAVQITVSGKPELMGYCHCNSCRHWSAGPINAFTLWKPDAVQVTQGADNIGAFDENPGSGDDAVYSIRKWCKSCGGHVLAEHPVMGLTDVYAATIPDFSFEPGIHANYQESVLRIKDGLPKFKDLPAEAGGSGEELPE